MMGRKEWKVKKGRRKKSEKSATRMGGQGERRKGGKGGLKICFWNIAGLNNKDEEVWEYMEEFDVVGLKETWFEKKEWEKLKKKLSKKFMWSY